MQVFASKVDRWLAAVLLAAALLAAVTLATTPVSGPADVLGRVLIAALAVGLPVWVLAGTRYAIDGGALRIRCGPFRWTVPIAEITEVRPTRNPLSSPALSLDRLEIRYGRGRTIMISPADRERFLEALDRSRRADR